MYQKIILDEEEEILIIIYHSEHAAKQAFDNNKNKDEAGITSYQTDNLILEATDVSNKLHERLQQMIENH